MTAREFFEMAKSLRLDYRLPWGVPNSTGFLFYKSGSPQRYFISREEAKTKFDVLRFVAVHNIEDYNMINATTAYATVEEISRECESYRFTVAN